MIIIYKDKDGDNDDDKDNLITISLWTKSYDEPGEGMYVPLLCSFSAPLEQFSSVP